jgi:hypothetical protein
MMKVVEEMTEYPQDASEAEPTWDEAVAALRSGEPVDLVRPNRKIVIDYRYEDGCVHASSPDLTGFEVTGSSLYETKELVRTDLARYLDSGVELVDREPRPILSESSSRSRVTHGPGERVTSTAGGRSRALIAPTRVRVA